MKKNFPLLLTLLCFCFGAFAQPTTNPATPPMRSANQVISIYSGAYTDVASTNFNPNWGQSGFGGATTFTVSGNEMRYYPNMNYQGVAFGSNQNVSSLDTLHLDVFSGNCSSIDIFLVADGAGEKAVNVPLTVGVWNSLNIALNGYTISPFAIPLTAIKEFKFVTVTPGSGANVYIDNMYFFTTKVLPTITGFTIPSKLLGDAPFAITAPTSNSAGAFTYTSSNTTVATIAGNTITILKAGSSTITANQAAAGSYAAGSTIATLSVTVAPLSTNAPNPTKPAANVRSIFSNTYPNLAGTTFRTSWSNGGSSLVDTAISGNNIKKYAGVDFIGIELASPTDLTLADSVHISMWTPTAAAFGFKIVNTGGGPANENLVWFDGLPGTFNRPAPLQGQWNVYSLPLSLFAQAGNGALILTQRNAIIQLLLVGKAPFGDNTYYIDNIYFSSSTNILPVDFKGFNISKTNNSAQLSWMVANEINLTAYEVEKSLNGKEFNTLATVVASGSDKYSFTDKDLVSGTNYYRIKAVDKDGKYKYSEIKNVTHSNSGKIDYSIYPNPAKNELVIKNLTGTNNISFVDAAGKVVLVRNNVTNGLTNINISALQNGVYTVVVNNGIENKTMKFVVNK